MSTEKAKRIRLICGCVSALLIAVCAVLLILGCVRIYNLGDRPFNRENVTAALQAIAIPGWLCLITVLGGIVLNLFLPAQSNKAKALRDQDDALAGFRGKYSELSSQEQSAVRAERKFRSAAIAVMAVLLVLLAIYPILYYADAAHFTVEDLGADVIRALLIAMIPAAIGLILVYVFRRLWASSVSRELDIYRKHPLKPGKVSHHPEKMIPILRWSILAAAVILIVLGVLNGGHKDVLDKAIKICTECIGLG